MEKRIRILPFLVIAILSVSLLSVISYNILLGSYYEVRSQYISLVNEQVIEEIETSIRFGKSLDNYYGMDQMLEKATSQLGEGYQILILSPEDQIQYARSGQVGSTFQLQDPRNQKIIRQEIFGQGGTQIGSFVTLYDKERERALASKEMGQLRMKTGIAAGILSLAALILMPLLARRSKRQETTMVAVIMGIMILQSAFLITSYQGTYRETVLASADGIANYVGISLQEIEEKGVTIDQITDLEAYLEEKSSYEMIESITVSSTETEILVETEVSDDFILKIILAMGLNFIAAIAVIFVITGESVRLSQMLDFRKTEVFNRRHPEQYRQMALILRYSNFLTSVGSYSCLAFSALMIRQWNQGAFGLSPGMTAALSISLCTLAEVTGLLLAPALARRLSTRKLLLASTALLIASNLACFFTGSSLMLLLLRTLSGLGFAGNKQASNSMIALGYETDKEREDNLVESNAGLIGGIMCGSSLGAIISAAFGYEATFVLATAFFVGYLVFLLYFIPWRLLTENSTARVSAEISIRGVMRLLIHPQVLRYSLTVNFPVYLFLMVIVVLIPGLIQSGGISPLVLTYSNLLNGLAGMYLGVKLGSLLRSRLNSNRGLLAVTVLGSVALLLQLLPNAVIALLVAAILLGLVDGTGVPLATDHFLALPVVKEGMDEATALTLLSIIGFAVMTLAPLILEICINSKMAILILAILLITLNLFMGKQYNLNMEGSDYNA